MPTVVTAILPRSTALAHVAPSWPTFRPFRSERVTPILQARMALAALAERRACDALWFGTMAQAAHYLAAAERHTVAALRIVERTLTLDTAALAADLLYRAASLGERADSLR